VYSIRGMLKGMNHAIRERAKTGRRNTTRRLWKTERGEGSVPKAKSYHVCRAIGVEAMDAGSRCVCIVLCGVDEMAPEIPPGP
jgi:hypothetical protein